MRKPKWTLQIGVNYTFYWIPYFIKCGLQWKDKFRTPRCEWSPHFELDWLWWSFQGYQEDDQYWEQWLWINNYKRTKEDWPWQKLDGTTSWKDYD